MNLNKLKPLLRKSLCISKEQGARLWIKNIEPILYVVDRGKTNILIKKQIKPVLEEDSQQYLIRKAIYIII